MATTTIVKFAVTLWFEASVHVISKVKVPACKGVPVICPVSALKLNPGIKVSPPAPLASVLPALVVSAPLASAPLVLVLLESSVFIQLLSV